MKPIACLALALLFAGAVEAAPAQAGTASATRGETGTLYGRMRSIVVAACSRSVGGDCVAGSAAGASNGVIHAIDTVLLPE
jgi:uncharacterized surface protein with fasciclin (FAS1) repeats